MKTIASILCAAVAVAAISVTIASCGGSKPVLHIYNWGDYLADSVVEKFEDEFNCKVVIDTFDSNEAMYAKLQAGAGGYDIVVPSAYMASLMYEQKMIQKLDVSRMPNVVKNFDQKYSNLLIDKNMDYCVPYFVSFTGIGYDTTRVENFMPSWHMFERADLKGHCSLLNDLRETIGSALITLGYSPNTTDTKKLDEAIALLVEWKKNIAKFGVDDCKQDLASGQMFLIHTYSGDMLQVQMEKPNIEFVIPKEGSTVTMDNFAITSDSKNVDLAYSFIDFMYRPDISAENMDEIMYVSPNVEGVKLVDPALRAHSAFSMPDDAFNRCTPLEDLGEANRHFIRAWDIIREE